MISCPAASPSRGARTRSPYKGEYILYLRAHTYVFPSYSRVPHLGTNEVSTAFITSNSHPKGEQPLAFGVSFGLNGVSELEVGR